MPTHLSLAFEHRGGSELLLVSGEIDLSTAPRLSEAVRRSAGPGAPLIADLTRVGFLDSAGARALTVADRELDARGGRLLTVPSPVVRRVVELSGIESALHLCDTVDAAFEAARRFAAARQGRED